MREGERKREEWAKGVGEQVDEVVKSLPGVRRFSFPVALTSL